MKKCVAVATQEKLYSEVEDKLADPLSPNPGPLRRSSGVRALFFLDEK
jgi:hypothetical protein